MKRILETKFGSHLYGTNTEKSDLDLKGIYLPEPREIILHSYQPTVQIKRNKEAGERNTSADVDREILSFDRFLKLLCEGQTMALDLLFAPSYLRVFEDSRLIHFFDRVYDQRHEFLSKNVNAFIGYARQQAAKYGIKGSRMDAVRRTIDALEDAGPHQRLYEWEDQIRTLVSESADLVSLEKTPLIEIINIPGPKGGEPMPHLHVAGRKMPFHANIRTVRSVYQAVLDAYGERSHKANLSGGKDYKALSHAIRVNGEAKELLLTGHITFPRPDADYLLRVKTEQVPYEEVSEVIESGLAELMEAKERSNLRETPNLEAADELIYETYDRVIRGKIYE